ncbi:IS21 family transposase [Bacteroidota bacterium]
METRRILRLYESGKSQRFIAEYLGISRNTVIKYISFYKVCGRSYEEITRMSDQQLNELFEPKVYILPEKLQKLQELLPILDQKLKRPGMTKKKIWEEYRKIYPDGYSDTQFCHYYNLWKKSRSVSMHIVHKAGDKMYIDFTGHKMRIVDKKTGDKTEVEVFAAILGASQYTYVEASRSQKKEDFVSCVENALHFFGGVPEAIVPDNLRSAVSSANRYEPVLNETFKDFAEHYQTIVFPTRIRKPKDKSLVEGVVKIIYNRIFVPLGKKVFNNLEELNVAILKELAKHNDTPLTGRNYSRRELFEQMEMNLLKPLPACPYQMKEYAVGTVYKNCHVFLPKDKHYYSVPFYYLRKKVKIVYTQKTVEIYHNYKLIASHERDKTPYQYTTISEHLPETHKHILDQSPETVIKEADDVGTYTRELVIKILEEGKYLGQSLRSCSGVINLAKKVGNDRVENASKRALEYGQHSFTIVRTILERGLDKITDEERNDIDLPDHKNIRGNQYYK